MNRAIQFIFLLTICFCVQRACAQTILEIPNQADVQRVIEVESNAKELSERWNGDSIRRSAELYLDASQQWIEINQKSRSADCLLESAQAVLLLGDNKEAIKLLNSALELKIQENDIAGKLKTYSLLSSAFLRTGKLKETAFYSKQAASISQSTNDSFAQSVYFNSLGETNYEQKKFDESIADFEKALFFQRESGDLRGEAQTLRALSYVYMSKGEPLAAMQYATESLDKCRRIGDLRGEVLAQIAVGRMNSKLDYKQIALDAYRQAEKLFPEDVDYLERGVLYSSIAQIYESYGDLALSLNYYQKAFDLFSKEQNPHAKLATLPSLGILTYRLGDEDFATRYFNQGFQLADKLHDKYFHSILLEELGNLYFETDKNKALGYYEQALSYFEKTRFKNRVALIKDNIGAIHESRGEYAVARRHYRSSLEISREIKNRFAEAEAIFHLAKLDAVEGKKEDSLESIKNSIEITDSLYSDVINSRLKRAYFSSVFERYGLYINLLMNMHRQFPHDGYDLQALQAAEKSRSRSMLESLRLSEANFNKDADTETVRRENEIRRLLNVKADRMTDFLSQNAEQTEIQKLSDEILELENQLEQIKVELKQNSPIYSAIKNPPPFDIAAFQQRVLDDNTLLLEFSFGDEESYLWLVGKREFAFYVLPARRKIETSVERLLQLLAAREPLPNESAEHYQTRLFEADKEYRHEARNLSDNLFGQISSAIAGKRLIVVPDGKLHYFPLSALPLPFSNDEQPILLTNEIVYEPSASTLLLLGNDTKKTNAENKNLLIFADPVFSNADPRVSNAAKTTEPSFSALTSLSIFRSAQTLDFLPRLHASKDEADSIIEIVGSGESNLASGFAATRERVLNAENSGYKIIHFATHGLLDRERPELSSLVLSRYDEKGNEQDGSIRLQDIYSLNLVADLVVLSACSTGIGKEVKGEGLMSLDNAFLQVGAKSVVSSLWKVDDYATRELMKNFYRELASGEVTTPEALRRAQIKMRENPQYQSPFYWAAFTVKGNFHTSPQLSKNFGYWIYYGALIPFLLLGVYFYYRRKAKLLNRKVVNNG